MAIKYPKLNPILRAIDYEARELALLDLELFIESTGERAKERNIDIIERMNEWAKERNVRCLPANMLTHTKDPSNFTLQ